VELNPTLLSNTYAFYGTGITSETGHIYIPSASLDAYLMKQIGQIFPI